MLEQSFATSLKMFEAYVDHLSHENGDLSSFYISYVVMVDVPLMTIRATIEGNWPLYLASMRKKIPCDFACDHQNYARYLSVYYNEMLGLENIIQQCMKHFKEVSSSYKLKTLIHL